MAGAGEPRRIPGESLSERLIERKGRSRRPQSAQVSSFFARFGILDPLRAPNVAGGAPDGFVYISGRPFYDLLKRLSAWEQRREARFGLHLGTGGQGSWSAFRRFGTGKAPVAHAPMALSALGSGDLMLLRPETQTPPADEGSTVETRSPSRRSGWFRREPKVRTIRSAAQAAPVRTPSYLRPERRERGETPALSPPHAKAIAAPQPARVRQPRRAMDRIASPGRTSVIAEIRPVLRTLEQIARATGGSRSGARVQRLANELRQSPPRRWAAQIREAVQEIEVEDAGVSEAVLAALPDTYARPMTLAFSRAQTATEAPSRGLRTVTGRSPMVRALAEPTAPSVTRHARAASARSAGRPARPRAAGRRASLGRAPVAGASSTAGTSASDEPGPSPQRISRGDRRDLADRATFLAAPAEAAEVSQAPADARRATRPVASAHVAGRLFGANASATRWSRAVSAAPAVRGARTSSAPLLTRLDVRRIRSDGIGLPEAFYARFGVVPAAVETGTPSSSVETGERIGPAGALDRLAAAQRRRGERQQRFEARHAADRLPVASKRWPGERTAALIRPLATDDLLLPKAQPEIAAEAPAEASSPTRRIASPAAARTPSVRARRPSATTRPVSSAAQRAARGEPKAAADRAMARAGQRLSPSATDPVLRALEEVARSAPSAVVARAATRAISALNRTEPDAPARARIVRDAITAMGPVARALAPDVEAALPDASARPAALAVGRMEDPRGQPRGLRPVMSRSPVLQELRPAPVEAAPAAAAEPRVVGSRADTRTGAPALSRAATKQPSAMRNAASRAVVPASTRLASSPVSRSSGARTALAASPVLRAARPAMPVLRAESAPASRRIPGAAPETPFASEIVAETAVPARRGTSTARVAARLAQAASDAETSADQADIPAVEPSETVAVPQAAHRAAARLELGATPGSVLPQTSPVAAARARRLAPPARLGAFAPDQQLLTQTVPSPAPIAETATPGTRPSRVAPVSRVALPTARSARPTPVGAPIPEGAFVPTALLAALRADSADLGSSPATPRRLGGLALAATRADLDVPGSVLPGVAPREDGSSPTLRSARIAFGVAPTLLSPAAPGTPEAAEASPAPPAWHAAPPRIRRAAERLAPAASAAPARSLVPRPVATAADHGGAQPAARQGTALAASARADRPVGVGYTAQRAFSEVRHPSDRRADARSPARYARASAAISLVFPSATAPSPLAAETAAAAVGPRSSARLRASTARPLDRASSRPVSAPEAAVSALRAPTSASAGVVRLYAEARAVEEVLRSLSRGPAAESSRRVSASARQILADVMAGIDTPTAADRGRDGRSVGTRHSLESVRASRLALTEVYSLLTQVAPMVPAEATAEASPARVRTGRPRPLDAARRTEIAEAVDRGARTPDRARRLTRLGLARSLFGGPMTLAAQAANAPAEAAGAEPIPAGRGPVGRGRRLPTRARLGRRARVAESFFLPTPGSPGGAGTTAAARGRRPGFSETLDAVDSGEGTPGLPGWAQRTTNRAAGVTATASTLLDAFHTARGPGDVLAAINRQESSTRSARTLPAPVLRLLDEIRAEASASLDTGPEEDPMAAALGGGRRSARSSSAVRVYSGFTNLNRSARAKAVDGMGEDRLMKLVRRLQGLIFLADGRKAEALRDVRLAEDSAAARAEGQASPTQSGDAKASQVDVDALAQEVVQHVQRELETRSERRAEDPDNKTPWW